MLKAPVPLRIEVEEEGLLVCVEVPCEEEDALETWEVGAPCELDGA